jgi:hypothetical protein
MRPQHWIGGVVGVLLGLIACSGNPTAPLEPGTYDLESIDGEALPFVAYDHPGERLEVVSGQIEFRSDASFWLTQTTRRTRPESVDLETFEHQGRFRRVGSTVFLHGSDGPDGSFGELTISPDEFSLRGSLGASVGWPPIVQYRRR